MKKIKPLILALFLSTKLFGQDFYDVNTINTIELTFAVSNWDQLLDSYHAAGNDEKLLGTAVINGMVFDSVGVAYKGNSTYNANNAKNPLNIKLDYVKDQNYQGYEVLKLANGAKDPSFVREVLSYEIARKYTVAPFSNYAKVYINGSYYGLFCSSESINNKFQKDFLNADKENTRVKCNPANVNNGGSSLAYLGADSTSYYTHYEMESDYGWQELMDLTNVISNNPTSLETVLDVDAAIWMLAFNNVLVNLDSYSGPFRQNFYLIKNNNGKMVSVIWDLNMSLGGFTNTGGEGSGTNSLITLNPLLRQGNSSYPLLNLILGNPTYKKMYMAHCRTILNENFANGWYFSRADSLQDIIDADYQADPNKFYTYTQFKNNLTTASGSGMQSTVGLSQLMDARENYLQTHQEYLYTTPIITNIQSNPQNATANSTITINATISNGTTAILGYRNSKKDEFQKIPMFDDGNHNDNLANDGIFGVQIFVEFGKIDYFVYAENTNSGMFSPERSQHEFYSLPVTNDVAINEIMASNSATVADQDGEFDDWIELYNNSASTLSLNGYFLTDEADSLTKWAFPDTTIAANGFLIVWADDDSGQVGLHANFKLSASGEKVLLVAPDTSIVEEITFLQQTTDFSFGRFPDGTGNFVEMQTPTFNAPNSISTSVFENTTIKNFRLSQNFPNPFNPTTKIAYELKAKGKAKLTIFNVLGEVVKEFSLEKQSGFVEWNGTNFSGKQVSSGIYFYRLQSGDFSETKKMLLLK
ncbi:CotH kinase family protein [bacterium]|nr:CotH kinase family protein [bacterium]